MSSLPSVTAVADSTILPPTAWPEQLRGRVLVAEDYLPSQMVAEFFLERLGLEVDLVMNGAETLAALTQKKYDVVLLDVYMPGIDGLEVARRVRAGEVPGCPPDLCLIATTTHSSAVDREKCRAAGMTDFLVKPFDLNQLAEYLRPWLRRECDAAPTQAAAPESAAAKNWPPDIASRAEVEPIFDYPHLLQALRGNTELFASYVEGFVQHSTEEMATVRQAVATGDGETVRHVAHNWTGACGYLRARPLLREIERLAQAARAGDRSAMQSAWPAVEQAMKCLHEALRQAQADAAT